MGAVPPFLLYALALPVGGLLDQGHHRRLNICAAVLITSSLSSLAFTNSHHHHREAGGGKYYAVLLCALPLGLGQSIFFLSSSHTARTWLPRRPGLAIGVVNAGAALGGSVFPLVVTSLTNAHSFRVAVLALAAIAGAQSIFVVGFAVAHPQHFRPVKHAASATPCCGSFLLCWRRRQQQQQQRLLRAMDDKAVMLFTAALCVVFAGILSIPFYLPTWSSLLLLRPPHHHFQPSATPTTNHRNSNGGGGMKISLLTILNLSQLPARTLSSLLTDHVRARHLHACVLLAAALVLPPFWLRLASASASGGAHPVEQGTAGSTVSGDDGGGQGAVTPAAAYAFTVVYGILHGGIVALTQNDLQEVLVARSARSAVGRPRERGRERCGSALVVAGEVRDSEDSEEGGELVGEYGQLSGLVYTLASPFMLAGPLVCGRLVDTVGVKGVGIWAAGCFGLGAVVMGVSLFVDGSVGKNKRSLARVVGDRLSQQPRVSCGDVSG
ncbi:uncharacterized protein HMPREF1541_07008 [Cyphellophora europaea CBS 101466]|uniref:Major facilitator superfamily (MFS) profile domain-containing protein n=1 Tax=Cyphellophora europaea (strain CBS 101466) TaxID=1220924 RepID=W2RR32_CYPE1|nr:uncharacterized protein HMPREF1541_07008 [Cyphellophora europaea CBS 101466]ETN38966.1 hypothetical protein HMPREF1541_07008 [Cyphellophora europaea CBS 101466]